MYDDRGELAGIALTSAAFAKTIPWFPYMAVAAIFAFSTMIAWSYYGLKSGHFYLVIPNILRIYLGYILYFCYYWFFSY